MTGHFSHVESTCITASVQMGKTLKPGISWSPVCCPANQGRRVDDSYGLEDCLGLKIAGSFQVFIGHLFTFFNH